jgi:cellulose synthase/poly-beta-1,6-N-acetylglucosamine synthase-like glycosyltransferase
MVVFDADMVAKPNFYTKILEVMLDDDCALCLTPQGFNNVDAQSDIFNNLNLSFWEYMLPGTDALGYIACTGTNFCLRCFPLADCGWFPSFTITEDYALGMMLKAKGYKAGYLNEYLAIGEAPEEPRNIFRQRSRWCKGQMQVCGALGCAERDCFVLRSEVAEDVWLNAHCFKQSVEDAICVACLQIVARIGCGLADV